MSHHLIRLLVAALLVFLLFQFHLAGRVGKEFHDAYVRFLHVVHAQSMFIPRH
jgi:hypothetical protein